MPADPLQAKADTLVEAAKVNAIALYTTAAPQFPSMARLDKRHWDFIVTIAGVFMAATRLNSLKLPVARHDALMQRVGERALAFAPDALGAFDDCKALFESNFDSLTAARHDPKFIGSDSLGTWIAWNTIGRSGSEEERRFIRVIGAMVTHAFFNWWTEGK